MTLPKYALYINGEWCLPHSQRYLPSYNPYQAKPWCLIPESDPEDVHKAVQAAWVAFQGEWSRYSATQRGALLRTLGKLIAQHADHLAHIEVQDNGKPLNEVSLQMRYLPEWYYYYAGLADKIEGRVLPGDKTHFFNFTRYEPLGVIAAIIPWNSPLLLATWKLAPLLAAGNTVVLKPSEEASASSLTLMLLVEKAGFPKGVVNVISGVGSEIGPALIEHPLVAKITFTGGTSTGKAIYQRAAAHLKKVTLELGGKSPHIVFADADLDNAAKGVLAGIFAASGQSCIAGSRLLVEASIQEVFVEKLIRLTKTAKMGDPLSRKTQIGPIATQSQLDKILHFFQIAQAEKAVCVLGGHKATRPECHTGWFVEPTIYTQVHNQMQIAQEEIFGPVLSVISFQTEEEAVQIANDTPYGLAAGLWTTQMRRALTLSEQLKAGTVWVNTYRALSYLSPFGGYKQSGIGREGGRAGIYEYLQLKSTWIAHQSEIANPFAMQLK